MKQHRDFFSSFLNGIFMFVSGFNFLGDKNIKVMSDSEAFKHDAEALRGDWDVVGSNLSSAMEKYNNFLDKR